jgi:uncharacterized protein
MLGELSNEQTEQILLRRIVGRIGCYANKKVYVVPVTFVYDNGYIYVHSREGLKVKMMRKNPEVCFQIDEIDNMANWRSVIAWGTYEELKSPEEQQSGMEILMKKLSPLITSETVTPSHGLQKPPLTVEKARRTVVYRIKLKETSGRYEKMP